MYECSVPLFQQYHLAGLNEYIRLYRVTGLGGTKKQTIGLVKKFIQVFHMSLQKNPNKLLGQPNISQIRLSPYLWYIHSVEFCCSLVVQLLCDPRDWGIPDKNTGMGYHFLL